MPEDVAYISSKSGVHTSRDGKVMSMAKRVSTDGQTAFRLYIVDNGWLEIYLLSKFFTFYAAQICFLKTK